MAYFYASLNGTAVIQLKDVPPRPPGLANELHYNDAAYDQDGLTAPLDKYSGWCTFEGASLSHTLTLCSAAGTWILT